MNYKDQKEPNQGWVEYEEPMESKIEENEGALPQLTVGVEYKLRFCGIQTG